MKISERQIHQIFQIAFGTINISGNIGGYNPKKRIEIINDIMNQQSDEVADTRDFELMKLATEDENDKPEQDNQESCEETRDS
jgi:hypothetical protein